MTDYGHDLRFGVFVTPDATRARAVLALAELADTSGLDLFTVQDHPYQERFLDAWTLLSTVAARTERITVSANVTNLPLRPPAVLAKSLASLDVLHPGRVELGLGAGAFWDAIAAAGGPRRSPREAVDALEEAIQVIRQAWAGGTVDVRGEHYDVHGLHAGPRPSHDLPIWLGAAKPRMLRLVGARADAWIPSASWAPPSQLPEMNRLIDQAALDAGRQPSQVRRMYNLSLGQGGVLGDPESWPSTIASLAREHGVGTFILPTDDERLLRYWADQVAPEARRLVAHLRATDAAPPDAVEPVQAGPAAQESAASPSLLHVSPTPDVPPLLESSRLDETTRPTARLLVAQTSLDSLASANADAQHLVDIHDHLRAELAQVRSLLEQVEHGHMGVGTARSMINTMSMRQNNWTLGAYCESYCRLVTGHHTLEDVSVFPHLSSQEPALQPVLERLEDEHHVIHEVLDDFDRALVQLVDGEDRTGEALAEVRHRLDELTDTLLSHLAYEERELLEPLARHGFR